MKTRELKILDEMVARGVPREIAKRGINWHAVRANPEVSMEELAFDLLRNRTVLASFPVPGVDEASDLIKWLLEKLGGILFPPPPPRPETFRATERTLRWCNKVRICELNENDHATVDISDNGIGGPDTPGTVEFSTGPEANAPVIDTLVGNGRVQFTGPKTIYAHLKGGTADSPDEDACDLKVDVQRFSSARR